MTRTTATRQRKRGAAVAESTTEPGKDDITIDRRRNPDRRANESESAEATPAPKLERRKKVNRRRQIDPTTCERDYTDQEVEFMNALDDYKRKSGRMFPTCSEVLEVIHSLGYVKLSSSQMVAIQANNPAGASAKPMPHDLQMSANDVAQLAAEKLLV
jgi:hypothetical protein